METPLSVGHPSRQLIMLYEVSWFLPPNGGGKGKRGFHTLVSEKTRKKVFYFSGNRGGGEVRPKLKILNFFCLFFWRLPLLTMFVGLVQKSPQKYSQKYPQKYPKSSPKVPLEALNFDSWDLNQIKIFIQLTDNPSIKCKILPRTKPSR